MYSRIKDLMKRSKVVFATAVIVLGVGVAGVAVTGAQNQPVSASTCDKVNIIYCGLSGSGIKGYINSLQDYYTSDKSGHSASPTVKKNYTDVKEVFKYFGASKSIINGMNSSNTKVGTLYRDGRVVVDGKTVGTKATVAARFSVAGSTRISGTNVYVRKTTSSFAQDKAKVIVYFKDGKMVFGAMVNCGNPIDAKPVEPPKPPVVEPPKPPVVKPQTLVCESLTASTTSVKNQFSFVAKAKPTNGATIANYQFVYGDTTVQDVPSTSTTANATHTYATPGTYNVVVNVSGNVNGSPVTVPVGNCKTTVTIEAPNQTLVCESLTASTTSVKNQFSFVAKAKPTNGATIANYQFVYGDTTVQDVPSTSTTANATHTYAKPGTYNVVVNVSGNVNGSPVTVPVGNCKTTVTIEAPTQVLTCEDLTGTPSATVKNQIDFTAKASTENGATISSYLVNFGDTESETINSTENSVSTSHVYAPGNYTAIVTVFGMANGSEVTATDSVNCATKIAIEVPPVEPCEFDPSLPVGHPDCVAPILPETGPTSIAALFGATSAFGAISHRMFLKRRLR